MVISQGICKDREKEIYTIVSPPPHTHTPFHPHSIPSPPSTARRGWKEGNKTLRCCPGIGAAPEQILVAWRGGNRDLLQVLLPPLHPPIICVSGCPLPKQPKPMEVPANAPWIHGGGGRGGTAHCFRCAGRGGDGTSPLTFAAIHNAAPTGSLPPPSLPPISGALQVPPTVGTHVGSAPPLPRSYTFGLQGSGEGGEGGGRL